MNWLSLVRVQFASAILASFQDPVLANQDTPSHKMNFDGHAWKESYTSAEYQ